MLLSQFIRRSICLLLLCLPATAIHAAPAVEKTPVVKETLVAKQSIGHLLPDPQQADWLASYGKDQLASQRGPLLLELVGQYEERLALLQKANPTSVPDWLILVSADLAVDGNKNGLVEELIPSVRLAMAEQLFLGEQYELALAWSGELEKEQVYSPALLVYLRTVSAYMIVDFEAAQTYLDDSVLDAGLLGKTREETLRQVTRRLASELAKKESPDKLPIVAQRMDAIERRLALGQGDTLTQEQQQRAIDDLDELIKKLEEEQKKQQQQQAAAGNASPSSPAEESRHSDLKGPGDVTQKRFSNGDAWGALSPAERERLTQGIDRDFPSHYRTLIQGYYQRIADGTSDSSKGTADGATPNEQQGSEP